MKETNLDKYGFECSLQNENVKQKIKKTNLAKYGFECSLQNENVKQKMKENNLQKYGCEHTFQSEIVKNNIKKSLIAKYGIEYISQNPKIREKAELTMLKKYGVKHFSQCSSVYKNQIAYSNKLYTFPSGKSVQIQGYENFALDVLINKYNENEIINKRCEVPRIEYDFNKKKHYYFPDIFIPKDNLIIEVKSYYIYKLHLIKNILKSHAVRNLKYNYEIWIFDNKRNLLII